MNNFPGNISPRGTPFGFTSFNYDAPFGRIRLVQTDRCSLAIVCIDSSSDLLFMWMSASYLVEVCQPTISLRLHWPLH